MEIVLNEITHLFCILRFVVWITEVRQIYDFRLFNSNGIPIFFWKRAQMTNLASYKSIDILTLIYLPSWALNSIGLIVAELLWNCAENIESCRVVNFECPENHKNIFLKWEKNNLGNFHFLTIFANEILQFFCILCFVVKITEVRQISDFRFFNSNAIPIFF